MTKTKTKEDAAKPRRKAVGLNLDERVIEYFKRVADESGLGYQGIINMYLLDCTKRNLRLEIKVD